MIDSSKVSSPILVILQSMGFSDFLNRKELVFDVVLIDIFLSRCFWNLISYMLCSHIQIVNAVFSSFWLITTSTTNPFSVSQRIFPGSVCHLTIHAGHLIEFEQNRPWRFDRWRKILIFQKIQNWFWILYFDFWTHSAWVRTVVIGCVIETRSIDYQVYSLLGYRTYSQFYVKIASWQQIS